MSNPAPRAVRYVVFHKPGSKWQSGLEVSDNSRQAWIADPDGIWPLQPPADWIRNAHV